MISFVFLYMNMITLKFMQLHDFNCITMDIHVHDDVNCIPIIET